MEKPIHEHDCGCCRFLGTHQDKYDLYFCAQGGFEPTVIARYGDRGDYHSGLRFSYDGVLKEAADRAIKQNFISTYEWEEATKVFRERD